MCGLNTFLFCLLSWSLEIPSLVLRQYGITSPWPTGSWHLRLATSSKSWMLPTRIGGGARSTMRRDGFLPALWGWVSAFTLLSCLLGYLSLASLSPALVLLLLPLLVAPHIFPRVFGHLPRAWASFNLCPSSFETFFLLFILTIPTSCLPPSTHCDFAQITSLFALMVLKTLLTLYCWEILPFLSLFCFPSFPCLLFFYPFFL